LPALEATLRKLRDVDALVCAGDLTGYYTWPDEVVAELIERGVRFIAGNHDRYLQSAPPNCGPLLAQSIEFTRRRLSPKNATLLAEKTCSAAMTFDGVRLAVFHGSPWDAQEQYIYPDFAGFDRFAGVDADVIVLGHTHRPMLREVAGRLVVNPGSCGQPRDGDDRAAYAVLDTATRQVSFGRVEYDIDAVAAAVDRAGLDERLKQMLRRSKPLVTERSGRS
jgi:putative phosphoesterase